MSSDRLIERFAHLIWYDFAQLTQANDLFWLAIREELLHVLPDLKLVSQLNRVQDCLSVWNSKSCFLTQACGYDLEFRPDLNLRCLGTPIYSIEGTKSHEHSSFLLVRKNSEIENIEQLEHSKAAINCWMSNSGMNLLRHTIAPYAKGNSNFFCEVHESGSHRQSIQMLTEERVDVICVDCISYHYIHEFLIQELRNTRILAQSTLSPLPPFCTSSFTSKDHQRLLIDTITKVIHENQNTEWLNKLRIIDFKELDPSEYRKLRQLQEESFALGFEMLPK